MKNLVLLFFIFFSIFSQKSLYAQGDNCNTALTLTNVTNYCSSNAAYTNVGSTASGFAVATCWGATGTEDVWFSFTATGTDVLVSVNGSGYGGTIVRPRIAIYSGSCSGTITQLACANGTAGSGFTQVYRGGLVLGQTYLIRISSTNGNEGTFGLCVNNYNPPASASADCAGAGKLCDKNPISVGTLNGGGTNANEPSSESGSCMTGDIFSDAETNSVWYTWTCGTSGTLLFDLTPLDPTNDLDYVLYQLSSTNPCGGRTIIRCNTSSCLNATGSSGLNATDTDVSEDPGCDAGENAYCQQINMVAGTSYALLINNADGTSGFNITWGGTGTFLGPDPNIVASNTTVCVGSSVTFDGSSSTNYSTLDWAFNSTGSPVTASGVGPHTINFPTVGNYVAILQANSAAGCSSVEYANISVVNGPTISVSPAAICPGASTVLVASGASSYTWNTGANTASVSVSPTVNTTYTVSAGANGCVSSNTVLVSINSVPSGVSAGTNQTLTCSASSVSLTGSVSSPVNPNYSWSGPGVCGSATSSITSACSQGIYTLTATDPSNGCVATSTVQVLPDVNAPAVSINPVTQTITCTNTLVAVGVTSTTTPVAYNWSGSGIVGLSTNSVISVSQSGIYSYTVTNTNNNCPTTGTVSVTGNTITPVTTAQVNGIITCVNNTVTIDAGISGMSYTWTAPSGGTVSSAFSESVTANGTGVYSLTVLNTVNGCTYSTTASVTSDLTAPSNLSAGTNQTLSCSSTSVTLSGSVSSPTNTSYSWAGNNICSASNTQNILACAAGVYTLTGTNPNTGCISTSTVEVFPSLGSPVISASSNTLILDCNNSMQTTTVSSNPSSDVTYVWNSSPQSVSAGGSVATFSAANVYTCTVTNTVSNCSSQLQVNVIDGVITPTVTGSGTQTITCINSSAVISTSVVPSSTYSYTWTGSGVSSATTNSVSVNVGGNYIVQVKDNVTGCLATNTFVVITNTTQPSVTTSNTVLPCYTNTINLFAVSPDADTYSWSTTNGTLISNSGFSVTAGSTGDYMVTAVNSVNGCSNTAIANVTQTLVSVSFTANPTSGIAPLSVGFGAQTNNTSSITWNFGDNNNNSSTTPNPSHVFNVPGTYVVTLTGTDQSGSCVETSTITIEVFENTTLIIPNVFTPNGDGVNDIFKIVATGMKDLNCDIFNRWGTKVYTISSPSGTWDGGGHTDGTYFFILKCNGYDGKEYKKEGYINMFR